MGLAWLTLGVNQTRGLALLTSRSNMISENLQSVLERIRTAHSATESDKKAPDLPRLVAVSKTKPKEDVMEAYKAGQRHFGENYVQEMVDKATDSELQSQCPDIRWHFIGNCQSNKVNKVAQTPNLFMMETVTSAKLADKLQKQFQDQNKTIKVMIQVNTSGEENKNGVEPDAAPEMAKHIAINCPNLELSGVMTIGALGHSLGTERPRPDGLNPDFVCLVECRSKIAEALGKSPEDFELSMGMSNDFEEAIKMGSTNVRVGSCIFGARNYSTKAGDSVKKIEDKLEETKLSNA